MGFFVVFFCFVFLQLLYSAIKEKNESAQMFCVFRLAEPLLKGKKDYLRFVFA